jgi:hypothetical protein
VVVRSSTEDPDADGDVDFVSVEVQLTELGIEEGEKPIADEDENAVSKRARKAKMLYAGSGE